MKKAQEKATLGADVPKSKTSLAAADGVGNLMNNSSSSNSFTSRRSPYTPIMNTSVHSKKGDQRDVDKTDSSKKKNRRRERKHKAKPTGQTFSAHSSNSTHPHSSPSFGKPASPSILSSVNQLGFKPKKEHAEAIHKEIGFKDLLEPKFSCEICAVRKPMTGKAFRKRNKRHKYVKLRSFLGPAKTCVFSTEICRLSAALNGLSLGPKKEKSRKYFKSLVIQQDYEPPMNLEMKTHTEVYVNKSEKSSSGNEATESVRIVQEDVLQEKQGKKEKKPKRERYRRLHKLEKREAKEAFPPAFTDDMVQIGMEKNQFVRGFVRINAKNPRDSYVSNENSALADYYINSVADRNGALDGDEVLLLVKPEDQWQDGNRTATVVRILKKIHPRITVGNLKAPDHNDFAIFCPRDKRMPMMRIPAVSWPNGFQKNPKLFAGNLFVAQLVEWPEPNMALGIITEHLGVAGDLLAETKSILKENCLDITPFPPDVVQYLPKSKEIPPDELKYREDIRKDCVFTIDPLTARDLDDAVSVKGLPNGNYEIGVHISDASHYLPEGTPLDQIISSKGTTIYLVDSVYHMLPVELCLHCSLLPGQDKLAFSVFWEMDEKGNVYNTRFARTVLNSCAQLAYEHAQQMIDNPYKEFNKDELPQIYNGFSGADLSKTVNVLQKIAVNLREARIQNGSLRIDQVKLLFSLNPQNGEPLDFITYENKESHRLIEEFMLLANISVAKQIQQAFPDIAFLRCHEPPKYKMLVEAQKCLETCGIHVDISSSGGIHSSLTKYITDDYQGRCRGIVLNHIFAKPMTRARYYCAGSMDDEEKFAHYALSVPIYTHFTSPIRRYADIMVHRLLAASLGYAKKPDWTLDHVISIAANCNKQKYNAKIAGEASSDLYLAHYIEKHQPYVQECVVIDVKDRSFDAIVLKTGSTVRIYQKRCEDNPTWKAEEIPQSTVQSKNELEQTKKAFRLIVDFPRTKTSPQRSKMIIDMFSVVKVELKRVPNSNKLEAYLLRPVLTRTFERTSSAN